DLFGAAGSIESISKESMVTVAYFSWTTTPSWFFFRTTPSSVPPFFRWIVSARMPEGATKRIRAGRNVFIPVPPLKNTATWRVRSAIVMPRGHRRGESRPILKVAKNAVQNCEMAGLEWDPGGGPLRPSPRRGKWEPRENYGWAAWKAL